MTDTSTAVTAMMLSPVAGMARDMACDIQSEASRGKKMDLPVECANAASVIWIEHIDAIFEAEIRKSEGAEPGDPMADMEYLCELRNKIVGLP